MRRQIPVLLSASACFIAVGTVPAFVHPESRTQVSQRTLTFAERVAYQRAIEEVYWRHRIWPKENRQPKPPLDAIVSEAQLEKKVEDYLGKSKLVADKRRSPITATELQAEMQRMASHTLHPRVLLELFQALAKDPFVIAECLARPLLAERLASELRGHGDVEAFAAANRKTLTTATALTSQSYRLPQISQLDCTDDTWTATTTVNAPDARSYYALVWTGSEMIVWGGAFLQNGYHFPNTGGRYDPATDTWTATSTTNAPIGRWLLAAVWTGSEMIIWGGGDNTDFLNTGGRYDPTNDSWVATSTTNAPEVRVRHTAVWTGSEMIVWGGYNYAHGNFNSGGRYNPDTDTWVATSRGTNLPEPRWAHSAVWTGTEMIVWGGTDDVNPYLNTGGRYNPATDSWVSTGVPNNVLGRIAHTTVWSGSEMVVWGGVDSTFNDSNTGGRYSPSTDSWTATSTNNAPSPRDSAAAVWTGSEMIVWGGVCCNPPTDFNTGGRYNPSTDSWTPTSTANAPQARNSLEQSNFAVWTGSEMIVWGEGYFVDGTFIFLNTGGRYCAQGGPSPTPTPTASPTPTATATVTPTATPSATATATFTPIPTPTPTATATPTPRPTLTPRSTPPSRPRPTPPPRP